jgi:hypothetical protein
VKELRLEGISTIEAANAFMPTYVDHYNALFGKVPRNAHDAHRPVRPGESSISWPIHKPIEGTPANISMSISFLMERSRFGRPGSRSPTPPTISWARLIKVLSLRVSVSATPFGSQDWCKRNATINTTQDRQQRIEVMGKLCPG